MLRLLLHHMDMISRTCKWQDGVLSGLGERLDDGASWFESFFSVVVMFLMCDSSLLTLSIRLGKVSAPFGSKK